MAWPLRLCIDRAQVFSFPSRRIGCRKSLLEVNFHWQHKIAAWAKAEAQPRVGLATAGDDEHYGPIGRAETASKRLFIRAAGIGRITGMRVNPNSAKLF